VSGQKTNGSWEDTSLDDAWDDLVAPANVGAALPKAPVVSPSVTPTPAIGSESKTAPSIAPVSAVPRPKAHTPPPPAVERVTRGANAGVSRPVTLAVQDRAAVSTGPKTVATRAAPAQAASEPPAPAEDSGTLRPNELEPPVTGTRRKSLARFVASIGIAAVMVLASLAWLKDGGQTVMSQIGRVLAPKAAPEPEAAARTTPPEPPAAERIFSEAPLPPGAVITAVEPTPRAPEAALAPPPPTATTEAATAPPLADEGTEGERRTNRVTVKTVPTGAAIFQAGKRLGTGQVELDVQPKVKLRLTALLDGHRPLNFTVDGTRETVTLMLRPIQSKAEASTTSDRSVEADPEGSGKSSPAAEAPQPTDPVTSP
jgi:hypothetical protein